MKICVVTTLHSAKDDRIYYKEVLSLVKRYRDITLVAPGGRNEPGNPVRFITIKRPRTMLGRTLAVLKAAWIVASLRPDIIHFHDFDLVVAVPLLRLFSRARLVYDVHEIYPDALMVSHHVPRALRRHAAALVDFIETQLARSTHLIFTAYDSAARGFALAHPRILELMNYPRIELFEQADKEDESIVARFRGKKVLLYHGTLAENNGLYHMLEAMPVISRADPSVLLLLIGLADDDLRSRVSTKATQLDIAGSVVMLPFVAHEVIPQFIRIAKIGLVPDQPSGQNMKGIPVKLFEYMVCGIPVLGARTPKIAYYLGESDAGRVYDSTDAQSLARNVIEMLSSEAELGRMGANGRRAVREKWNWGSMERRLFEAYGELDVQVRQRPSVPRRRADARVVSP